MPSVKIHVAASPPPRYPKEDPEPPTSAEKGNAVLLDRMRAAVVTHYRTSPSAPHRPIDLTHVHEEPFVSLMTNANAKIDRSVGGGMMQQETQDTEEDEEEEDYVPPSLADYVANVSRALEEQQMEFLNSTSRSETRDEQSDPDAIFPLTTSISFHGNDALSHRRRNSSDGLPPLWSPESCFRSPPPLNPASLLTDTQLQKQALSSSSSFSQGDRPLLRSLTPFSLSSAKRKVEDPPAASPPKPFSVEVVEQPTEAVPSNSTAMLASPDQRSSAGQEVVFREVEDDEEEVATVASTKEEQSSYNADSDVLPEQKDLMQLLSAMTTTEPEHSVAAYMDSLCISTKEEVAFVSTDNKAVTLPSRERSSKKVAQDGSVDTQAVEPSPMAALLTRVGNAPSSRSKAALRTNPSDEDTESRQLMIASSLSTDTNKIPSPPKRMFTNRPPTSPKSLATPSPRYSDAKRTTLNAASTSNDRRCVPPTPIATQESPKPLTSNVSTPSPLSMSSANQKAFGGRGAAFQPSLSSSSTISSIPASPVPRFRSPPTSPRVKTAPRFTAETADRLSRPNKTPPPHYTSPLRKNKTNSQPKRGASSSASSKNPLISPQPRALTPSVAAHPTIASTNRRSEPTPAVKAVEPRVPSSQKKQPPPQQTLRPGAIDTRVSDTTPTRRRSMERLVRHSKVLKNGRQSPFNGNLTVSTAAPVEPPTVPKIDTGSPTTIGSPLNSYKLSKGFELSLRQSPSQKMAPSPPPFHSEENVIERLSRPTAARMTAIQCTLNPPLPRDEEEELPPRPPSPFVFTAETADRLNQPTAARSAAIHATVAPSNHRRNSSGSVCGGGSVSSRDGGYESSGERHLPPPLDPSSHLLHNTAVSDAKKTAPKPVIVRLPPPKKYVSGASDRLMKRTVANQALVAGRKEPDPREKSVVKKPTPAEKPKFTVQDGIAKAKERVRQRQLQKKQEEQRKGLPPMHPSMHTPSNTAHRPIVAKRPLTVPCGPRVANIRLAKDRLSSSRTEDPSLAQRLDIFGKGLRDDFSVGSHGSSFSRRSLTIPTGPKLATDIRGGEKYIPPKSRSDISLAQSTDLLQHGLRSPYHSTSSHRGLTIPMSPKFAPVPSRQRPKSTDELEAEEMEYFNSHRFKAKPPLGQRYAIVSGSSSGQVPGFMKPTAVSKLSQRQDRSVAVEPRKAASVSSRSHSHSSQLRREVDPIVERADRVAKALALREEARQQKLALEEAEREELARFKAKPVPRTTYQYTPVVPAPSGPLVEPFSPELQTKHRVIERREFDLQAEQERAMRLAELQAMEARHRAEEEEDLQERRRLPVSEGGLIPVAAPINAVLLR